MSFYTIRIFGAELKDIKSPNSFKPMRMMCTFFGLFKEKQSRLIVLNVCFMSL